MAAQQEVSAAVEARRASMRQAAALAKAGQLPASEKKPGPSAGAVAMAQRVRRLGERVTAQRQVEQAAAETRQGRATQATRLAVKLAELLGDFGSIPFYEQVVDRLYAGQLCPALEREVVMKMLLGKAQELRRLKYPNGPIIRPGAVFTAWLKTLEKEG